MPVLVLCHWTRHIGPATKRWLDFSVVIGTLGNLDSRAVVFCQCLIY